MRLPLGVKLTLTTSVAVAIALGTFALITGKSLGGGMPWISAGALLVSGVLGAVWQSIRVVRPLRAMADATRDIAGGDLSRRVPVESRDEVGAMAQNLNTMAEALEALLHDREAQARVNQELELARTLQKAMLPPSDAVASAGHVVFGTSRPASRCGGDWWLHHEISPTRLLLVVADATGHGVGAALIAATARGALLAVIEAKGEALTTDDVMRAFAAGTMRSNATTGETPMTSLVVICDVATGELQYRNCGMPFPLLVAGGGVTALTSLQVATRHPWRRGETLVMYSDGLTEQQNAKGMRFGDRRLAAVLRAQGGTLLARDHRAVIDAGIEFAGGIAPDDDITLVMCQAPQGPQDS
ncbi:MAG: SpoIIE family protein phosphatase [Myxococcales bacterium]|nr:SpoIIE family protein phosphatase [Myxococcales bacterium]